jgi:hypothetical protein
MQPWKGVIEVALAARPRPAGPHAALEAELGEAAYGGTVLAVQAEEFEPELVLCGSGDGVAALEEQPQRRSARGLPGLHPGAPQTPELLQGAPRQGTPRSGASVAALPQRSEFGRGRSSSAITSQ